MPPDTQTEFQPGSRKKVLLNKLGIQRKREIDQAEYAALFKAQERYLSVVNSETRFTSALLRQMHRDWLGDIYWWAGEYRTVNLTKNEFTWPPAIRVPANMENFEQTLLAKHTPCPAGPVKDVARRMAVVHSDLLLIHPFRDGNGRLARWLADLMANQAGYPTPDYQFSGKRSFARFAYYVECVRKGYEENYDDLAGFFAEALEAGLAFEDFL